MTKADYFEAKETDIYFEQDRDKLIQSLHKIKKKLKDFDSVYTIKEAYFLDCIESIGKVIFKAEELKRKN